MDETSFEFGEITGATLSDTATGARNSPSLRLEAASLNRPLPGYRCESEFGHPPHTVDHRPVRDGLALIGPTGDIIDRATLVM